MPSYATRESEHAGPCTKGDPEEHGHPEHPPAVAAYEVAAAPEGAQAAGSLEHNDGHGHRPDCEQVGAGCEQQDRPHDSNHGDAPDVRADSDYRPDGERKDSNEATE